MQDTQAPHLGVVAEPTSAPGRHRRGRRWLVAGIALIVVLAAGAGGFAFWMSHRGPGHASVTKALDHYRASSGASSGDGSRPQPGVYTYAGTGQEHLSFLATHQSEDGNLPGTVALGAGACWTFTVEYNSFHQQGWSFCTVDGKLIERANTTDQRFDFGLLSQSEHTEVVCRPPIVLADPTSTPGHRDPVRCTGHSQTTKADMTQRGHVELVGRTTVVIGGKRVPALHVTQDVTIAGGQHGVQHEDLWIEAQTGLPLREQRSIRVASPAPAPLNHVTYTERGGWLLTSMTPRT